jgi:4-nitrophenyl phosphatase
MQNSGGDRNPVGFVVLRSEIFIDARREQVNMSSHSALSLSQSIPLSKYTCLIFDCDGVLWNEHEVIPNSIQTLQCLESSNKLLIFVTNNSSKSREQYMKKFDQLNFKLNTLSKDTVFSSSYAAAHYLANECKEKFNAATDKVFIIGDTGIGIEMRELGINNTLEARSLLGQKFWSKKELIEFSPDPAISAVVVGIDDELTYTKVAYANAALRNKAKKTLFISTNQDSTLPTNGNTLPGGGSCVAMVATASEQQPINVGKPESYMLQLVFKQFNLKKESCLMIGDRLDTDILFGIRGEIDTLLVETGIHNRNHVQAIGNTIKPTYILSSVADLQKFL